MTRRDTGSGPPRSRGELSLLAVAAALILSAAHPPTDATPAASQSGVRETRAVRLAITIDDLPWVGPLPAGETAEQALTAIGGVLREHDAPATGFVVCDHGRRDPAPLRAWARLGLGLGNHSAAHRDLNRTPVEDWLADVVRCHEYLQRFGDATRPYFRFPMLHQGDTEEKRARVAEHLRETGLRTAHVTVDNSEYLLARVHARALATDDAELLGAVRDEFIRHIAAALEHADDVARRKVGRSVPHILLLHANTLVRDRLDALLDDLAARGVELVTLERALADPVYARPDEYVGPVGLSWLYRMRPLSTEDAAWDEAEAAAIRERFAGAL